MERLRIFQVFPLVLTLSASFAGCAGTGQGLVSGPSGAPSRLSESRGRSQYADRSNGSQSDSARAGVETGQPNSVSDRVAKYFPKLNRDPSDLVHRTDRDLWADSTRSRNQASQGSDAMMANAGGSRAEVETSVLPVALQIAPGPDGVSAETQVDPGVVSMGAFQPVPLNQAPTAPRPYQGPTYYTVPAPAAVTPGWSGPTPFAAPVPPAVPPEGSSATQPPALANSGFQLVAYVDDPQNPGVVVAANPLPQNPDQIRLPDLAANVEPQNTAAPRMVYSLPVGSPSARSDLAPEPPPAPRTTTDAPTLPSPNSSVAMPPPTMPTSSSIPAPSVPAPVSSTPPQASKPVSTPPSDSGLTPVPVAPEPNAPPISTTTPTPVPSSAAPSTSIPPIPSTTSGSPFYPTTTMQSTSSGAAPSYQQPPYSAPAPSTQQMYAAPAPSYQSIPYAAPAPSYQSMPYVAPSYQSMPVASPQSPTKMAPTKVAPSPQAPSKMLSAPNHPSWVMVMPSAQSTSKVMPSAQSPSKVMPSAQSAPRKVMPSAQSDPFRGLNCAPPPRASSQQPSPWHHKQPSSNANLFDRIGDWFDSRRAPAATNKHGKLFPTLPSKQSPSFAPTYSYPTYAAPQYSYPSSQAAEWQAMGWPVITGFPMMVPMSGPSPVASPAPSPSSPVSAPAQVPGQTQTQLVSYVPPLPSAGSQAVVPAQGITPANLYPVAYYASREEWLRAYSTAYSNNPGVTPATNAAPTTSAPAYYFIPTQPMPLMNGSQPQPQPSVAPQPAEDSTSYAPPRRVSLLARIFGRGREVERSEPKGDENVMTTSNTAEPFGSGGPLVPMNFVPSAPQVRYEATGPALGVPPGYLSPRAESGNLPQGGN